MKKHEPGDYEVLEFKIAEITFKLEKWAAKIKSRESTHFDLVQIAKAMMDESLRLKRFIDTKFRVREGKTK